jgi:hypothetical protein
MGMAYGRLDVFWPDGKFETFALADDNVSVGRYSGNTITLDTDTISRYHFAITRQGDQVGITDLDSANGTFVDGARVPNNQKRPLQGGEEIQIGHLRMIYHAVDEGPTLPITTVVDDTQRVRRQTPTFTVEIYGPEIAVPPGSNTSAEIVITNLRDEARIFAVEVTGMPEGWLRVNRPQVEVDPNDSSSVLINIKPLRQSDSAPGDYKISVVVTPIDATDQRLEAEITARVLPYSGFGVALSTSRVVSGEMFRLHVHNQGSAGLPLFITGRSKGDRLQFGIPTPQMILAPGQRLVVQGEIKPKQVRLFGASHDYPYDLIIRSRDEAGFLVAVPGRFVERPTLPGWAALALAGLTVALVALIAVGLLIFITAPEPDPTITRFDAVTDTVQQGQFLTLMWEADHADRLTIRVNGDDVADNLPPDMTSYQLDTREYQGPITIELLAFDGGDPVTQALNVTVNALLTVELFEVEPARLVRHTVQEITIRWNVPGAVRSQVEGLGVFSATPLTQNFTDAGEITDLTGLADESFVLTLRAEDLSGQSVTGEVQVIVIEPLCAAVDGDMTIYAAPDATANVVGTLPNASTRPVDGRSADAAWLRVPLEGEIVGWILNDPERLECGDEFAPEDLLPVPTPTVEATRTPLPATPTRTPTPTRTATVPRSTTAPPQSLPPAGPVLPQSGARPTATPTAQG